MWGMQKKTCPVAMLDAAIEQFNQYGYRKTTMEDVAQRLGLSRSLLYVHFKNKKDIFRQASRLVHERALDECQKQIEADMNFEAKTAALLIARHKPFLEAELLSSHGAELFNEYSRLCGSIVLESNANFEEILANHFRQAASKSQIATLDPGRSSEEIAWLLNHSVAGLKHGVTSLEDFELRVRALVRLTLEGLLPR